jgi:hypothetical protein
MFSCPWSRCCPSSPRGSDSRASVRRLTGRSRSGQFERHSTAQPCQARVETGPSGKEAEGIRASASTCLSPRCLSLLARRRGVAERAAVLAEGRWPQASVLSQPAAGLCVAASQPSLGQGKRRGSEGGQREGQEHADAMRTRMRCGATRRNGLAWQAGWAAHPNQPSRAAQCTIHPFVALLCWSA